METFGNWASPVRLMENGGKEGEREVAAEVEEEQEEGARAFSKPTNYELC